MCVGGGGGVLGRCALPLAATALVLCVEQEKQERVEKSRKGGEGIRARPTNGTVGQLKTDESISRFSSASFNSITISFFFNFFLPVDKEANRRS